MAPGEASRPVAHGQSNSRAVSSSRIGIPRYCQAWSPPTSADGAHRAASSSDPPQRDEPRQPPFGKQQTAEAADAETVETEDQGKVR